MNPKMFLIFSAVFMQMLMPSSCLAFLAGQNVQICIESEQSGRIDEYCNNCLVNQNTLRSNILNCVNTMVMSDSVRMYTRLCPNNASLFTTTGACRFITSSTLLACTGLTSTATLGTATLSLDQFRCILINGSRQLRFVLRVSRQVYELFRFYNLDFGMSTVNGKKKRDTSAETDLFESQCVENKKNGVEYVYTFKRSTPAEENKQTLE